MRSPVIERLMVRRSQVALKHVIYDMVTRTLMMELRRRAIKRWVLCGDMDRRLKIPHSAKVECGFRTTPKECLYDTGLIGLKYRASQYNIIRSLDILVYSLTARKLRGDLIETYTLLHGFTNVDYRIFFQKHDDHPECTDHNTRGHDWKLFKPQSKKGLQCRVHFFSQIVINYWNDLPCQVVTASSVNSFKSRLDNYWH